MQQVQRFRRYWPVAVILVIGLGVVTGLSATGDDFGRVGWACGAIGVIAGVAIAAISGRDNSRGERG